MVQGNEVTKAVTYSGGEMLPKDSFLMHMLHYVLGDELFFPILIMLATNPSCTCHNFITSADVEQLFSKQSGIDLRPLFDFFLRPTDLVDCIIKEINCHTLSVKLNYFFMPLPIDTGTDACGHFLKKVLIQ